VPPATSSAAGVLWTSDDGAILGIAVDRDRIFCVTKSKLTSMARDGSQVRTLVQSPALYFYGGAIAVNGGAAFLGTTGGVESVPRDGGKTTTIGAGAFSTFGIAVDDANVYWITDSNVMKAPQGGGDATALAPPWQTASTDAFTILDGYLYWSKNEDGATDGVMRIPVTGGTPDGLARGPDFSVVPNGRGGIAWLDDTSREIVSMTGGTETRRTISGLVDEIASDGTTWFWRDSVTGAVNALTDGETTPRTLTTPEPAATQNNGLGRHIVVDQGQIVWTSHTGPTAYDVSVLRSIAVPR
jgi:hypothetical protein